MRTIRTKVYQFSELSKEAQTKAIENCWDINLMDRWHESTYDDAQNIGLKITGFNLDRGNYVSGEIIGTHEETAKLIIENHGEVVETYKTAKEFLNQLYAYHDKADGEEEGEFDSEIEELEEEFLKDLCEDYRIILRDFYEYLGSQEAIKETIEANQYEFHKDGRRY